MPHPLQVVARNGGDIATFAPYVASINDGGVIAYQATMRNGSTGVLTSDGRQSGRSPSSCRGR